MPLLKEKTSKMGSAVGVLLVAALFTIYILALPEFFLSTMGRMFAIIWAMIAICIFLAHSRRLSVRQRRVRRILPGVSAKGSVSHNRKELLRG